MKVVTKGPEATAGSISKHSKRLVLYGTCQADKGLCRIEPSVLQNAMVHIGYEAVKRKTFRTQNYLRISTED